MTTSALEQVYSGKVKAIAGKILRNRGIAVVDADDITQEVAIWHWQSAYVALEWRAANVAKNAIESEKAAKRGGSATKNYIDSANEPGLIDSPLDRLVQGESAEAVREAIGRLPADLKRVIEMRFTEGLTFAQMSFEMTGNPKSVQNVINKLKRAIEILSEELSRFA